MTTSCRSARSCSRDLCHGAQARLTPLLLLASCGPGQEAGSRALYELEHLSFVPPASCSLPNEDLTLTRSILIDRLEFTRGDLKHYWPDREARARHYAWREPAAKDSAERENWPAFMDFHEAEELAALRGMRLPSPAEWLHVALGRRDFQSPWGGPGREFFANTVVIDQDGEDFSLKAPSNVGTYENGKSRPFGCYDLLGNVWEWVDGLVLGFEPPRHKQDELDDDLGTMTSIMGGAYDTVWRPTFQLDRGTNRQRFHARRVHKSDLSPSVGVRMCADAESYLWDRAAHWGTSAEVRVRVRAMGRIWAENDALARAELTRLLAELRLRPGAAPGLAWLEAGVLAEP